tara:strand:+ start:8 stop:517 length:510 start_codon:yes stop_codon:yes gene_type:complete
MEYNKFIRNIPDFPKKGIVFKDITPLLSNKKSYNSLMNTIKTRYKNYKIDKVVGIEARGFILGSALAILLNCGFTPIRKKGKLPFKTFSETYDLEYGKDTLEIHKDAFNKNDNIIIVDDVLATGGTIKASFNLLQNFEINIIETYFLIEILKLEGGENLDFNYFSLIKV